MIVKNGSLYFGKCKLNSVTLQSGHGLTDINGDAQSQDITGDSSADVSSFRLVLGSGSTEPTIDDIWLDVPVTSASQVSYGATTIDINTRGNTVFTRSITNVSGSEITLSELALNLLCSGMSQDYMLAREVLETPCTLSPNETVTFSYEVAFN